MRRYCCPILFGLLISLFSGDSSACDVPVFRYALERWPTERYVLEYDTANGFSPQLNSAVAFLRSSASESGGLTNLALQPGSEITAAGLSAELYCPLPGGRTLEIWSGELTEKTASRIVDSPLRREIASRLGDGQNAVWVLLLSGNAGRDRAASETLESTLDELEGSLSLPETLKEIDGEGLPKLKVDFSLLELSRADLEEEIFTSMLIASEPDLANYSYQPIAFPVFGRGRVLYALVGDGIDRSNIRDACAFLVGPCACEIKDLSPGMDLLMTADWSRLAGKSWVDRVNGGPLTSLAAIVGFRRQNAGYGMKAAKRSAAPVFSILAALAVVLVVVVLVSLRIVKSSKTRDK